MQSSPGEGGAALAVGASLDGMPEQCSACRSRGRPGEVLAVEVGPRDGEDARGTRHPGAVDEGAAHPGNWLEYDGPVVVTHGPLPESTGCGPASGRRRVVPMLGRASEVTRVESLLRDARSGRSGSLFISGEPGIGKTLLLAHARAAAETEGMLVFEASRAEGDAHLPFAGLYDLVRPALGDSKTCRSLRLLRCAALSRSGRQPLATGSPSTRRRSARARSDGASDDHSALNAPGLLALGFQ